jgi:GGDEF domain-containing protein
MSNKNKSGIGGVIAAICILIYIFALVQAAVRVYLSIDKCKVTAEGEFSRIAAFASQAGTQGFMNNRFIEQMNTALSSSNILEAMIITGSEGEYAFEREQGHAIAWVNNSPRFINRLSFSSQPYYKPLQIQNMGSANIRAVARAFDYNEILIILKETLLLILGKPESVQTVDDASDSKRQYERDSQKENYFTAEEKPQELPAVNNVPFTADETIPKGLYSPRSGIGWQEYINDRLNSELYRCSSTENDLTLILIEFMDLKNDEMYKQAAEETASFFSSKDLLFEYGRYGIAIILPGIDLAAGISKSEKFYQRIAGKFPHNKKETLGVCIGLSSRSGRLLNAGRLTLECREALEKAKYDPNSSIVAFKSDPEKYRAFIASQN